METEDNKPDVGTQQNEPAPTEPTPTDPKKEDTVTLEAMTNLFNEMKATNEELQKQVHDLQVTNKQMALRVGIEKPTTDSDLFSGFGRVYK